VERGQRKAKRWQEISLPFFPNDQICNVITEVREVLREGSVPDTGTVSHLTVKITEISSCFSEFPTFGGFLQKNGGMGAFL